MSEEETRQFYETIAKAQPWNPVGKRPITGIESYLQKLRMWVVQHHMNPNSLAKACHMAEGTLRHMFKQTWNPTFDTMKRIELYMLMVDAKQREAATQPEARSAVAPSGTAPAELHQ